MIRSSATTVNDFILLIHDDAPPATPEAWERYLELLRGSGRFAGGSSIGAGLCLRKDGAPRPLTPRLAGYVRVSAIDFADARTLLAGNPVFEAGGTVEIRELPRQ